MGHLSAGWREPRSGVRIPRSDSTADRAELKVVLKQLHGGGHLIGRVRLSVTDAALPVGIDVLPAEVLAILETPAPERSESQRHALARQYFLETATRELATLPPPLLTYAAASQFEPDGGLKPPPGPRPIHLLQRGEISKPLELVAPGALGCVTELPSAFDVPEGSDESVRRAALARWLTDSAQSAHVAVDRQSSVASSLRRRDCADAQRLWPHGRDRPRTRNCSIGSPCSFATAINRSRTCIG